MSETNEIKLKPCPFCDGKSEIGVLRSGNEGKLFLAECSVCGISTNLFYNAKDAARVWNRRTGEQGVK